MIYFILLLLYIEGSTRAVRIHWQPTTSFSDPRNWSPSSSNRSFAACNRAEIPDDIDGPILLQASVIIEELILPLNGVLAFAEESSLIFDDGYDNRFMKNKDCIQDVFVYSGSYSKDLFDPDNYCIESPTTIEDLQQPKQDEKKEPLQERDTNEAFSDKNCPRADRLHVDQLPTAEDDLVFPRQGHFVVDMSTLDVVMSVKSIEVNGKVFDENQAFSSYLASDLGQTQFLKSNHRNSTHFSIRNYGIPCVQLGNCHHSEVVREHVCYGHQCPTLNCFATLTTRRACCPVCPGSSLLVTTSPHEPPMDLRLLRRILSRETRQNKLITVKVAYVSDTSTEIIFEDLNPEGKHSFYTAESFMKRLQEGEINELTHYKHLKVTLDRSYNTPPRQRLSNIKVGWFSKLSYVVAGLIIFMVLCIIYVVRNSGQVKNVMRKLPFISAYTTTGKYRLDVSESTTEMVSNNFQNQMYNSNINIRDDNEQDAGSEIF